MKVIQCNPRRYEDVRFRRNGAPGMSVHWIKRMGPLTSPSARLGLGLVRFKERTCVIHPETWVRVFVGVFRNQPAHERAPFEENKHIQIESCRSGSSQKKAQDTKCTQGNALSSCERLPRVSCVRSQIIESLNPIHTPHWFQCASGKSGLSPTHLSPANGGFLAPKTPRLEGFRILFKDSK